VTRLRQTNLPVALTVSHGNHGWILTGFRATADPAKTASFTVTSVRVTGPLYGLQSKNGYDMAPNTKLTTAQLKRFFTPWRYAPRRMIWDGRYVSIQPVPLKAPSAAVASATPSRATTAAARAVASPPAITPAPTATPTSSAVPAVALVASASPDMSGGAAASDAVPTADTSPGPIGLVAVGGLAVAATAGLLAFRLRRRPA
jgi:hypothetical protein